MVQVGVGAVLWIALALPVMAADSAAIAAPLDDIMEVTTLDEVVVTGRLDSLSGLRAALIEAEDRFYQRWNDLNDDDRLDVFCRTEAPTGTRLTQRRCVTQLVDEMTRAQALTVVGITQGATRYEPNDGIRLQAAAELKKRTLLMLEHDAELRRALLERARLQELYEARRKEKFDDGRWFAWD